MEFVTCGMARDGRRHEHAALEPSQALVRFLADGVPKSHKMYLVVLGNARSLPPSHMGLGMSQAQSHPAVELCRVVCGPHLLRILDILAATKPPEPDRSLLQALFGPRDSTFVFLAGDKLPHYMPYLKETNPFMQTLSNAQRQVVPEDRISLGTLPGLVECFLINPIVNDAFTVEQLQHVVQHWKDFLNRLYGPLPADEPFAHMFRNPLPIALSSRANWEKEASRAHVSQWPLGPIAKAIRTAITSLTAAEKNPEKKYSFTDLLSKMQLVHELVKGWMTLQQERVKVPTQVRVRTGDWMYQRKSDATPDYYVFRPNDT
jgi:hypothetical protein